MLQNKVKTLLRIRTLECMYCKLPRSIQYSKIECFSDNKWIGWKCYLYVSQGKNFVSGNRFAAWSDIQFELCIHL